MSEARVHHAVAAMHALVAVAWTLAVAWMFRKSDRGFPYDFCWLPTLLVAFGWVLWKRWKWTRVLVLIVYWPTFVAAIGLLSFCLYVLLLVPARDIAVAHVLAGLGVLFLSPVLLVSGCTLWCLHRRKAW